MAKKDPKDRPTQLYPRDLALLDSPLMQDMARRAEFLNALKHYVEKDFDYKPADDVVQMAVEQMRLALIQRCERYDGICNKNRDNINNRWTTNEDERVPSTTNEDERVPSNTNEDERVPSNTNENERVPSNTIINMENKFLFYWQLFINFLILGDEGRALSYAVAADPKKEIIDFCQSIKAEQNGGRRIEMRHALEGKKEHQEARNRFMNFSEWRDFWDLATELKKMRASMAYIMAFAEEYNTHINENGIFKTLLNKARYIENGKAISNIKGFLANRNMQT